MKNQSRGIIELKILKKLTSKEISKRKERVLLMKKYKGVIKKGTI